MAPRYYSDHRVFAHTPKTSTEPPQPFVYMLPLTDGQGFKLGRTANPLRRISAFSIRYFEDFNLRTALLVRCKAKAQTTALEKTLKHIAAVRIEPPDWLAWGVRCPTEWFANTAGAAVRERLEALGNDPDFADSTLDTAYDEIKRQLAASQERMTAWTIMTWDEVLERAAARGGHHVSTLIGRQLVATLDAYQYFGMPLLGGWEPDMEFLVSNRKH